MISYPFENVSAPHVGERKRIPFSLLGVIVFVTLIALVVWLNLSRERVKDEAVRANLESIVAQATIVKSGLGTYGATDRNDCAQALYADPTIQAALIAIRISNGYGEEHCRVSPDSFLIVVSRPDRGFYQPDSKYWCADSTGAVCALNSSESTEERRCSCS